MHSCPICGEPMGPTKLRALDRLVTGEGPFGVAECDTCELGLTTPQLSEQELGRFYADSYYENFYEHSERHRGILVRLRDWLRRRSAERRNSAPPFNFKEPVRGSVLDVGCGSGELLQSFATKGWKTYGIDPSAAAVAAAERRGANGYEGTLQDHPWQKESFEAILFQHSLEHVTGPVPTLEEAQ